VAFSPDGQRLCTTNTLDGSTKAWDLRSGKEVPPGGNDKVATLWEGVAFTPDGRRIAVASGSLVRILDLELRADELAWRLTVARPDLDWQQQQADRAIEAKDWFVAASHLEQLSQARPLEAGLWRDLAMAQLAFAEGDLDRQRHARMPQADCPPRRPDPHGYAAYRRTCERILQQYRPRADASLAVVLLRPPGPASSGLLDATLLTGAVSQALDMRQAAVWPCLLCPDAVADPARLLALSEGPEADVHGAALCRAGRYAEAVKVLSGNQYVSAWFFRALAEGRHGHRAEAKQTLRTVVRWLESPSRTDPRQTNADGLPWQVRLEVDVLRREVEELLAPAPP
jgi:hypothetical protein